MRTGNSRWSPICLCPCGSKASHPWGFTWVPSWVLCPNPWCGHMMDWLVWVFLLHCTRLGYNPKSLWQSCWQPGEGTFCRKPFCRKTILIVMVCGPLEMNDRAAWISIMLGLWDIPTAAPKPNTNDNQSACTVLPPPFACPPLPQEGGLGWRCVMALQYGCVCSRRVCCSLELNLQQRQILKG